MDDATYRERVHALRKAGGALALDIIMHSDRRELDRRAAAGDQRCRRLLQTLLEMHEAIAARPRRAPIQCSTCPTPLRKTRWAAVVVAPEVSDDPAQALSFAVCTTCGPTRSDVQAKAVPVLQKLFPGGHVVVPGPGGRT